MIVSIDHTCWEEKEKKYDFYDRNPIMTPDHESLPTNAAEEMTFFFLYSDRHRFSLDRDRTRGAHFQFIITYHLRSNSTLHTAIVVATVDLIPTYM